jgi:hypothetical protein
MIVFPWLILAFLLLILAVLIASVPGRMRWLRSRGAEQFVYPSIVSVATVGAMLLLAFVAWYLLLGPRD